MQLVSVLFAFMAIVCLLWVSIDASINSSCVSHSQYFALNDIYNSLNGFNWTWKNTSEYGPTWNFTENYSCPCFPLWQGLTCISDGVGNYSIEVVSLQSYGLNGTLPDSIALLSDLTELDIGDNFIRGGLPEAFGNMTKLQILKVFNNFLTKQLPDSLGNMSSLSYFDLHNNYDLLSSIPATITRLQSLSTWSWYQCKLFGSLPDDIGNMTSLYSLQLYDNELTGTLPESIGMLKMLWSFDYSHNFMSGSLPDSIGNLSALQYLRNQGNLLTGWLVFLYLYLKFNTTVGPFPESIGNLLSMTFINPTSNYFSQSLPLTICNLTQITCINLYVNDFTGPIPPCIGELKLLTNLQWNSNYFTGPFVDGLLELVHATDIRFISNLMSGTIPDSWQKMTYLQQIYFSNNLFHGTIPKSLGTIANLTTLYCNTNFFTGHFSGILNTTLQTRITQIAINNNFFTGTLPLDILGVPTLSTFIASVNCFTGTIPAVVCNSSMLYIFAVDGATAADKCKVPLLDGTYTLANKRLTGSVPACLYSMPHLNTLHLSGNLLNTQLDNSIHLSSSIDTLVLSHNQVTGYIPTSFQHRQWTLLDLSYNQISGTLDSSWTAQSTNNSIILDVNRLSGQIPSALQKMDNITMLNGNIFVCTYQRTGLPTADPYYSQYSCGSNTFNMIIFLLLCTMGIFAILSVLIRHRILISNSVSLSGSLTRLKDFIDVRLKVFKPTDNERTPIVEAGEYFQRLRWSAVASCSICLLCLVAYETLRLHYSTFSFLYAWTLSSLYLSGRVSGLTLWALWFSLFSCTIYVVLWKSKEVEKTETMNGEIRKKTSKTLVISLVGTLLVNVIVVGGANALFVYVSLTCTNQQVAFAEVGLALFKMSWTKLILYYLTSHGLLLRNYGSRSTLIIINSVIIPIITTAAIDTSCFYNVLANAPAISIDLNTGCGEYECTDGICTCLQTSVNDIVFTFPPPFLYSYQCMSSLIVTYVPVFAEIMLFDTIYVPFRAIIVRWMSKSSINEAAESSESAGEREWSLWQMFLQNFFYDDITRNYDEARLVRRKQVLNFDNYMLAIVTHLAILLTWGLMFPPLAVITSLALIVRSYYIQIAVGQSYLRTRSNEELKIILDSELGCFRQYSRQAFLPLLVTGCLFCGLVVFDTLGSLSKLSISFTLTSLLAFGPLIVGWMLCVIPRFSSSDSQNAQMKTTDLEMRVSSQQ